MAMVVEIEHIWAQEWLMSVVVDTNDNSASGKPSKKATKTTGRVTPKKTKGNVPASSAKVGRYKTAQESGKYTPPIPKYVRRSPAWFGIAILATLILGVVVILLDYLTGLPFLGQGSSIYLLIGLVLIFAGFLMATRYR